MAAVLALDQIAALLVILAAAWLVWTRPGVMTWGFFLFVLWFNPGRSYEDYACLQYYPAALLAQNFIPLYEGTRPYQTLPFQWSLHVCDAHGRLRHREFLADGAGDPRREFATTLIEALSATSLPIVVHSAYERTQLRDLSNLFPDLSDALGVVIARLAALLPVVRSGVYLREFEFSNSIKSVAPALCPTFSYDDLEGVADGMAASGAFLRLASGEVAEAGEAQELRRQLLAYCERDTLAMVEVHRALKTLAAAKDG